MVNKEKLSTVIMDIDSLIHSDGGMGFIKIRAFCDDVDALAQAGDMKAIHIVTEINRLRNILNFVVKSIGVELDEQSTTR